MFVADWHSVRILVRNERAYNHSRAFDGRRRASTHNARTLRAADRGVSVHTRALGAPLRGVGSAAADVAAVATAGGKRPSRSQLY